MDASVVIKYQAARDKANTIKNCAAAMETLFNEFSNTITLLTETQFKGTAGSDLRNRYDELRAELPKYVNAVERFAIVITNEVNELEKAEQNITSQQANL